MRVAIADDSVIVREGLARVLDDRHLSVIGLAENAEQLLALIEAEHPDVAILDIRMPPTQTDEGLVAADVIRGRFPDVGVLVLSQYTDVAYALRLLKGDEKGRGYLLKDRITAVDELVDALERINAGECVVDHELISALLANPARSDRLAALTPRERDVLALLAEGLTDRGIGQRMWLSQSTVETHVRHILQKLDLPTGTAHNRRVHAVLTYLDR